MVVLTISRSNICGDSITDYGSSRFIKLPIDNYLKLLGMYDTINRPQIALINAVNNPSYRFVCAALARRLGKTYISNVIAQLVSLIPDSHVLVISPNYSLSSISFELQRKLIRHFDLEVKRDNVKDRVIELDIGSTIRMGSISTVDSSVGRSYDLILFDEAALSESGESAFNIQLRPTLDKPASKAIFISTPRGRENWFSRFYQRGFSDIYPEWCSIQADYTENTRMSSSDVEEARRSLPKSEFEQEYMASFTSYVGQIYEGFNTSHIVDSLPSDLRGETFAGCDPGFRDATAFVVIVYDGLLFWVVADYCESERTTQQHSEHFHQLIDTWNIETIFIDSAAAQFSADLAYNYDIATTRARKDVLPGIAYVQSLIVSGRLRVLSSCKHVLGMIDQYRWDDREGLLRERPKHDSWSHIADAVRYALYTYVV